MRHDEADDIVAIGRREMKSLEGAVVGLAEWKRDRRKAKEAAEAKEAKEDKEPSA